MTKTKSATSAYRHVAVTAEEIKNGEPAVIATLSPGDVVRQGDVMLVCLDGDRLIGNAAASRQLAPGISQGSRHFAEGDCSILNCDEAEVLKHLNRLIPATRGQLLFIGPVIVANGPVTITHPEHAHRTLPGDSTYAVVYQRVFSKEIRRAMD